MSSAKNGARSMPPITCALWDVACPRSSQPTLYHVRFSCSSTLLCLVLSITYLAVACDVPSACLNTPCCTCIPSSVTWMAGQPNAACITSIFRHVVMGACLACNVHDAPPSPLLLGLSHREHDRMGTIVGRAVAMWENSMIEARQVTEWHSHQAGTGGVMYWTSWCVLHAVSLGTNEERPVLLNKGWCSDERAFVRNRNVLQHCMGWNGRQGRTLMHVVGRFVMLLVMYPSFYKVQAWSFVPHRIVWENDNGGTDGGRRRIRPQTGRGLG